MLVTINTDAAYRHDYKFGAYAYWIMCDNGKLFSRGELKGEILDAMTAELMAVVKAMHRLANSKWNTIERIIINTDCMIVIKYMTTADPDKLPAKLKKKFDPICEIYTKLINTERLKHADIEFRHVKAHTKVKDSRSHVNRWCDMSAKLSLNEMIHKAKLLTTKQ